VAIALVSSVRFPSTGGTTSSAIDTTGANLLICLLSNMVGTTITDSKSNTWTALTLYSGTGPDIKFLYAKNATTGTGHTFTTPNWDQAVVAAFSGADTSAPFDQENGQNQGAGITTPGSITPTANGALVVAGIASINFAGTATVDSSMSIIDQAASVGGNPEGSALAYIVQGTAGAIAPTWTLAASAGSANIASFLAATGGGAAGVPGPPIVVPRYAVHRSTLQ